MLPVIVVATKKTPSALVRCRFDRIYHDRSTTPTLAHAIASDSATTNTAPPIPLVPSALAAIGDGQTSGLVRAATGVFRVERGFLSDRPAEAVWTLSNADSEDWLKVVERHAGPTFDDVGRIRVGIKTTADQVFIRDDWNLLPLDRRPEVELLRPLLRHFGAARWLAGTQQQAVLYPHTVSGGAPAAHRSGRFPKGKPLPGGPSSATVAQAIRRR